MEVRVQHCPVNVLLGVSFDENMNLLCVWNVAQNTQAAGIPCRHLIHRAGQLEGSHELGTLQTEHPLTCLVVG